MTIQETNNSGTDLLKTQTRATSDIWILVSLAMGFIMATLDVTVVNVAIADIQEKLQISLSNTTWIVDGYMLFFASLLLAGGSLANRYGAKNIYLIGLTIFIIASVLCAVASTGTILIGARSLQGIGAALFMPSSLSLLAISYPDASKRAKMFGMWSAIVSISSGLGPFVGGVLVNTFGWRSIFLINIPIGIIGLLMAYLIVASSPGKKRNLNIFNHILGIITLAGLSFALIEGPSYGWSSALIVTAIIVTIITAFLFIYIERRVKDPIIPMELFKNSSFSAANLVGFLINLALFGGIFMFGLFLQKAKGASPFIAGVELLPMMAVFVIGNLIFARLTTRLGVKVPMLTSITIAGIGSLILMLCVSSAPYWILAAIYAIANLGIGIAVPAMTATVMQAAGKEHANIAGATLNANRQVGALVGVAIMGIVLHEAHSWYTGASIAFLVMGIAYLGASFLTWRFVRT
ncbi:DHA2 family methylenomycin A resistance protein-like MFS transporter [Bacillus thuringiensis]|uniref:DHA2 family methylenomycin A resistance protein-like MFS transporter n=1 Tax=Bacillus thuringiensis TaxID=1428 RepID=A0A4R4B245_BACTU|nr:MFS transporter [Bacillus thuringiensis]TCW47581.1 DHA2 family methylenomycin A resistance protein-like MFS transporter [Bacillus thuringiensis]TCW47737.1 DHA2 family methylenomycin A resistance protein-like MFS transporter [Bacillus thuringiensis]